MKSPLLSRFSPMPSSSPLLSRSPLHRLSSLRLRSSLQPPPRLRHRHVRLCSIPSGSEDEGSETIKDDDHLGAGLNNLVDESEALALAELWKLPSLAVFSFAGVPALIGYLGEAAGVERVPAWMPLVYALASFLIGSMLVIEASVSDEERQKYDDRGVDDLAFLQSEKVLRRLTWRVPTAAFAATAAGEAALRAAGEATGVRDLHPPVWVAFLLFGLLFGVPYGVLSTSFDPAVQGSRLGWDEFVGKMRDAKDLDRRDRGSK